MHCIDLGERFPTSFFLQKSASIQPRTSPVKFARSPCTDPPGEPWDKRSLCKDPAQGKACRAFESVCEEGTTPWHPIEPNARASDAEGYCSGDWTGGMLVDRVKIPAWLPAGDYVLSWRWDCEETAQIWTNCADVTIKVGQISDMVV